MAPKKAPPAKRAAPATDAPAAKKQKTAATTPAAAAPAAQQKPVAAKAPAKAAAATTAAAPKAPVKAAAAAKPKAKEAAAPKTTPAATATTPAATPAPTSTPAAPAATKSEVKPKAEGGEKKVAVIPQKKGKKGSLRKVKSASDKNNWISAKAYAERAGVLYVGHLPHGFYEYELRRYLSQYGPVRRLRVSRNPNTGRSRGYAFVQFEQKGTAEKAANELNGMYLSEKVLRANVMQPYEVHKSTFRGSHSTFLRTLDAKTRRDGRDMSAKPAGAAYAEDPKKNREEIVKSHNDTLKKLGINYQFNPNVTL